MWISEATAILDNFSNRVQNGLWVVLIHFALSPYWITFRFPTILGNFFLTAPLWFFHEVINEFIQLSPFENLCAISQPCLSCLRTQSNIGHYSSDYWYELVPHAPKCTIHSEVLKVLIPNGNPCLSPHFYFHFSYVS